MEKGTAASEGRAGLTSASEPVADESVARDGSARPSPARDGRSRAAAVAVVASAAVLVALGILGSILTIGDHLEDAHPALAVLFYCMVAVLVLIGVVWPLARVAAHPVFALYRLRDERGRANKRRCKMLADNLEQNVGLTEQEKVRLEAALDAGDDADDLLIALFKEKVVPAIDAESKRAAKTAFFATAISHSPLVDVATMLTVNFNLVRAIVERCGFRPNNVSLARIYVRVMGSALVAGGLEDMDLDGLLSGLIGTGAGAKVSGVVLASASEGLVSAFLTYRVGVITKRYLCAENGPADMGEVRRASYSEALGLMRTSGFMGEVVEAVRVKTAQMGAAAAQAAKSAAKSAAESAARSAWEAAESAAGAVAAAARDNPISHVFNGHR